MAKIVVKMKKAKNMIFVFFLLKKMLRGAERIWPPSAARRSVAVPNGEGVASGSATQNPLTNQKRILYVLVLIPSLCHFYL